MQGAWCASAPGSLEEGNELSSGLSAERSNYKVTGWEWVILDCIRATSENQGATSFSHELADAPILGRLEGNEVPGRSAPGTKAGEEARRNVCQQPEERCPRKLLSTHPPHTALPAADVSKCISVLFAE